MEIKNMFGTKPINLQRNKIIIPVPKQERDYPAYSYLRDNFGIKFCTDEKEDNFEFECIAQFSIFAVDVDGNCYGTVGGIGDLINDEYFVGYVDLKKKRCGIITNNIKQFLELIVYHPNWYEEIHKSEKPILQNKSSLKYAQDFLIKEFSLKNDKDILNKVYRNICKHEFKIFERTNDITTQYSSLCAEGGNII